MSYSRPRLLAGLLIAGLAIATATAHVWRTRLARSARGPIGPRIYAPEIEHDFGEVEFGQEISREFTIHNTGDEPLRIKDIVRTCSCTAAEPTKIIVPPGASTTLRFNYQAAGGGTFRYGVLVWTNAKENGGRVVFTLSGKVIQRLTVSPPKLLFDLSPGPASAEVEKIITVYLRDDQVEVDHATSTADWLQVAPCSGVKTTELGREQQYAVRLLKTPSNAGAARIQFHLKGTKVPTLDVEALVQHRLPLRISPRFVHRSTPQSQLPIRQEIVIENPGAEGADDVDLTSECSWLAIKRLTPPVGQDKSGGPLRFEVLAGNQALALGVHRSAIRVTSRAAPEAKQEIPVILAVQP